MQGWDLIKRNDTLLCCTRRDVHWKKISDDKHDDEACSWRWEWDFIICRKFVKELLSINRSNIKKGIEKSIGIATTYGEGQLE